MRSRKSIVQFSAALIITLMVAIPGMARAYDDSVALHGIETGKAFFNANTSKMTAESLPMMLHGVVLTYNSLVEQGVDPDFIVSFSGLNVGWLTDGADPMVKGLVQQIDALGVRVEICAVALMMSGVIPESVLPEIDIIGNNWISAIAYQSKSKGYARIEF